MATNSEDVEIVNSVEDEVFFGPTERELLKAVFLRKRFLIRRRRTVTLHGRDSLTQFHSDETASESMSTQEKRGNSERSETPITSFDEEKTFKNLLPSIATVREDDGTLQSNNLSDSFSKSVKKRETNKESHSESDSSPPSIARTRNINNDLDKTDKCCQTSFLYIAIDKETNCFIEPKPKMVDQFLLPIAPTKFTPKKSSLNPSREIKKTPENKTKGKTPEKKIKQYNNVFSPVGKYIKGTAVVTPFITNVLSNSIITHRKKKPTPVSNVKFESFQLPKPTVHRH